ncbi:TRAF-type zinc finger domain-containing protein 1 [Amborella trichopoda]|uniref:TRAF-type zinc finger domain-containing protein 1 n=1 Tax=Amborella trichopoda TaxID=13333 RepID=UPI0005D3982B|nr:TRAF-type zinc finger domain-containing protein 1 [Amborella trichopoda]XP_011627874.1 TRAF-type zinc finger domain-containing protein 1 [Amborella trichopoda]|eukprot:XP_011627873.1 TRAF-type zinc finger domain-containing protein 1 [Amborella trichopoda]
MNSMAVSTEFSTTLCNHCDRDIPAPNFDLHYAHCIRNLEKCRICGDMVPKKHSEEHYLNTHAPVSCSLCSETVEREVLTLHKGERCPQRIVTCEYCEFPLPVVDLFKHQEVCGNRTEYCEICCKYVRLRERLDHERQFHSGTPGVPAEPSRVAESASDWGQRGIPRGRAHDSSQKRLFFTIALTGIAVLIGSFFLQRRPQTPEQ